MKASSNIGLVEVESCTILKKIFMTTFLFLYCEGPNTSGPYRLLRKYTTTIESLLHH